MSKKSLVMFGAIAAVILLASCKKDHTCTCTLTDNGPPVVTTTQDFPMGKTKKSAAETLCTSTQAAQSLMYDVASCKLK